MRADTTLRFWDVYSGTCLETFGGHTSSVNSVFLSVDGRYALSGSEDKTLKIWEVPSGRCLRTFEGHTGCVSSLFVSEHGRYALSGGGTLGKGYMLKLWEVANGRAHSAPWEVAKTLASETAVTVQSQFEECLRMARVALEHADEVQAAGALRRARALPECQRRPEGFIAWQALYAHLPKRAFLGGWEERTFVGHTNCVSSVFLSVDGRYALSGSWDKTLK
jgi:WD40 repeat protein